MLEVDWEIPAGSVLFAVFCYLIDDLFKQGDSGGPLTVKPKHRRQHILIGETSFGKWMGYKDENGVVHNRPCGNPGLYGVYGRISFFRKWIEENMKGPVFCKMGANALF